MALNFFFNKSSQTDGTYKKYLENQIQGKEKENEILRNRIKNLKVDIARNEAEIQKLNQEYFQLNKKSDSFPSKAPTNDQQIPQHPPQKKTKAAAVFGFLAAGLLIFAFFSIPAVVGFSFFLIVAGIIFLLFR